MCGSGSQGQLGIGYMPVKEYRPVKAMVDERIVKVSCGDLHTGFLTDQGNAYVTGDNSLCQLGIGHQGVLYVARPILMTHFAAGSSTIKDLCCAHLGSYSVAINTRNEMFIWGYYQSSVASTSIPLRIDLPNEIRSLSQIACSRNLVSILDKHGKVWLWSAQKGCDENLKSIPSNPTQVEGLRSNTIKKVYLGHSFIVCMGHTVGDPGQNRAIVTQPTQTSAPL